MSQIFLTNHSNGIDFSEMDDEMKELYVWMSSFGLTDYTRQLYQWGASKRQLSEMDNEEIDDLAKKLTKNVTHQRCFMREVANLKSQQIQHPIFNKHPNNSNLFENNNNYSNNKMQYQENMVSNTFQTGEVRHFDELRQKPMLKSMSSINSMQSSQTQPSQLRPTSNTASASIMNTPSLPQTNLNININESEMMMRHNFNAFGAPMGLDSNGLNGPLRNRPNTILGVLNGNETALNGNQQMNNDKDNDADADNEDSNDDSNSDSESGSDSDSESGSDEESDSGSDSDSENESGSNSGNEKDEKQNKDINNNINNNANMNHNVNELQEKMNNLCLKANANLVNNNINNNNNSNTLTNSNNEMNGCEITSEMLLNLIYQCNGNFNFNPQNLNDKNATNGNNAFNAINASNAMNGMNFGNLNQMNHQTSNQRNQQMGNNWNQNNSHANTTNTNNKNNNNNNVNINYNQNQTNTMKSAMNINNNQFSHGSKHLNVHIPTQVDDAFDITSMFETDFKTNNNYNNNNNSNNNINQFESTFESKVNINNFEDDEPRIMLGNDNYREERQWFCMIDCVPMGGQCDEQMYWMPYPNHIQKILFDKWNEYCKNPNNVNNETISIDLNQRQYKIWFIKDQIESKTPSAFQISDTGVTRQIICDKMDKTGCVWGFRVLPM